MKIVSKILYPPYEDKEYIEYCHLYSITNLVHRGNQLPANYQLPILPTQYKSVGRITLCQPCTIDNQTLVLLWGKWVIGWSEDY